MHFLIKVESLFKIRQISKKQPQDIRGRFFIFRSSSFYQDQGDFLIFKCNFFKDQPLQLTTKSSPKFLSLSIADPFIFKIFYLAKSSLPKSKPKSIPPITNSTPFLYLSNKLYKLYILKRLESILLRVGWVGFYICFILQVGEMWKLKVIAHGFLKV